MLPTNRMPFSLKTWIEEHRDLLKPPVGNAQVWQNTQFMVTIVGGPNKRNDFHVNEGEEFFYQLEGDIHLELMLPEGRSKLPIREGDIFLLPSRIPHSPQRPAASVGLVIEYIRQPGQLDAFQWFCNECNEKLYEEYFHLTNIVTQLPPVFERYWSSQAHRTCKKCGTVQEKPR